MNLTKEQQKAKEQFTPGPWIAIDQGTGARGKSLGICISNAIGLPMFFVPRGNDRNVANARLIAAAPELYEALNELVSISDRKHDAWDKAKAALAKARGEA